MLFMVALLRAARDDGLAARGAATACSLAFGIPLLQQAARVSHAPNSTAQRTREIRDE